MEYANESMRSDRLIVSSNTVHSFIHSKAFRLRAAVHVCSKAKGQRKRINVTVNFMIPVLGRFDMAGS